MVPWFIWEGLEGVVQPPLRQRKNACAFTATSRQIEYQLRIAYAQAKPPVLLGEEPLFNHKEWQNKLSKKFPWKTSEKDRWKPWDLLHEARDRLEMTKIDKISTGEMGDGIPNKNGIPHYIEEKYGVCNFHGATDEKKVEHLGDVLRKRIPVIAVIHLNNYSTLANKVYTGLNDDGTSAIEGVEDLGEHAVVIVGVNEVEEGNPYNVEPGTYWMYQDSLQPGEQSAPGLFGNLIGMLHPRVVIEAYFGLSRIDNLLFGKLGKKESDAICQELSVVLKRDRATIAGYPSKEGEGSSKKRKAGSTLKEGEGSSKKPK